MRTANSVCLLAAIAILFAGCTQRLAQLTVVSTKNMEWNRTNEYVRSNQAIVGKDISHMIIFIPTKFQVTIDEAIKNALEQIPGAVAMVDATLKYRFIYALVYAQSGYIIEGTVLIDPKLAGGKTAPSYEFSYDEETEELKQEAPEEKVLEPVKSIPEKKGKK